MIDLPQGVYGFQTEQPMHVECLQLHHYSQFHNFPWQLIMVGGVVSPALNT